MNPALRPLHRHIRAAKRVELDWCHDELIRERTKLREGSAEASRIHEVVAYREVVQSIRTWPLDTSTFVRAALYLLIPLGSWAGAPDPVTTVTSSPRAARCSAR